MAVRPGRRRRASAGLVPLAVALLVAACGSPGLYEPPAEAGTAVVPSGTAAPTTSGEPPASFEAPAQTPLASGPPEPANDWQRVLAGIGHDGRVPLDTALAAFELAIGDLPGVDTPGEPVALTDGTGPILWVLGHWDELTPDQQAAVNELLIVPTPTTGLHVGGLGAAVGVGPARNARFFEEDLEAWKAKIAEARTAIEGSFKRELKLPVDVVFGNIPRKPGEENAPQPAAQAFPVDDNGLSVLGRPTRCKILVTDRGQGLTGFEFTHVAAHELFHCFQFDVATDIKAHYRVAPWLAEGSAAWVGEVVSAGSTVGAEWWEYWLKEPQRPLPGRVYDGIGFFAHLGDSGIDPWGLLYKMLKEGEKGGPAAYLVATKASGADRMIDSWGASYIHHQTLAPDWTMNGPGLPDALRIPIQSATIDKNSSYIVSTPPQSGVAGRFDLQADVLVLMSKPARGLIRFSDGSQKTLNEVIGKPLCAKPGGCTCPTGSAGAGHSWGQAASGEVLVGLSGHVENPHMIVDGYGVDTTCEKDPKDFQEEPPCYCPPGALGSRPDERRATS